MPLGGNSYGLGITFSIAYTLLELVSYVEQKGFSYYMPYDSIGSDVYETLALCAINTKRINLVPV